MRSALFALAPLLIIASGCAAQRIHPSAPGSSAPGSSAIGSSAIGASAIGASAIGASAIGGSELGGSELGAGSVVPFVLPTPDRSWLEDVLHPRRAAWRQWGERHLQTGDLVFTRGNYYLLLGAINFSDFISTVSDSPFSHVGIVAIEDGQPVVYEISDSGLRSTPFARYVTQSHFESVAVRRPVPETYAALPKVLRYVREQQAANTRFDRQFELHNDSLYCSELIVNAFAAGGVQLARPLTVEELPGLAKAGSWSVTVARLATGLEPTSEVYTIGNDTSGLYGSPLLVECLPPTEL